MKKGTLRRAFFIRTRVRGQFSHSNISHAGSAGPGTGSVLTFQHFSCTRGYAGTRGYGVSSHIPTFLTGYVGYGVSSHIPTGTGSVLTFQRVRGQFSHSNISHGVRRVRGQFSHSNISHAHRAVSCFRTALLTVM